VPNSTIGICGGKIGLLYVVNCSDLGQVVPVGAKDRVLQEIKVATSGHIHGSPVFWQVLGAYSSGLCMR
jgi:hypothetical protein